MYVQSNLRITILFGARAPAAEDPAPCANCHGVAFFSSPHEHVRTALALQPA